MGIGTAVPGSKLSVAGNASITGTLTVIPETTGIFISGAGAQSAGLQVANPQHIGVSISNPKGTGLVIANAESIGISMSTTQTSGNGIIVNHNGTGYAMTIDSAKSLGLKVTTSDADGIWVDQKGTDDVGIVVLSKGRGIQVSSGSGQWALSTQGDVNIGGNLNVSGIIQGSSKAFVIDHPLDPQGKTLTHGSLEGPEFGVYYRGTAKLSGGKTTVTLPAYFEKLTRKEGRTVQLTAKGSEPFLLSYEDIKDGKFVVRGTKANGEFSWEVKAVRADIAPLEVERAKTK